jgi:hypothetical protein
MRVDKKMREIDSCGGFDKSSQPRWCGCFPRMFSRSAVRLVSNKETGCYLRGSVCVIFSCGFNRWCLWCTTCNKLVYVCLRLGFLLCLDGTFFAFFISRTFFYPCGSHNISVFYANHILTCTGEGNWQRFLRFSELLILVRPNKWPHLCFSIEDGNIRFPKIYVWSVFRNNGSWGMSRNQEF